MGIIFGSLLVASLVLAVFLYLAACEALAKAKGYNPVIIATMLLGGLAAIIPPLAIEFLRRSFYSRPCLTSAARRKRNSARLQSLPFWESSIFLD